jgi:predicted RNA methylase
MMNSKISDFVEKFQWLFFLQNPPYGSNIFCHHQARHACFMDFAGSSVLRLDTSLTLTITNNPIYNDKSKQHHPKRIPPIYRSTITDSYIQASQQARH